MSTTGHMDLEQDQLPDCEEHQRQLEVFSMEAKQMICPSCLMYGRFKGHNVISKEEAVVYLRQQLNQLSKDGMLKADYCDNTLLDIRQNKLQLQENQAKITQEIETNFSSLIKALKARKAKVLANFDAQFEGEIAKLAEQEKRWEHKEALTEELIDLTKTEKDNEVLLASRHMVDSIACVREQKQQHRITLLKNVYTTLQLNNDTLGMAQLQKAIETFIVQGESINIQYRS